MRCLCREGNFPGHGPQKGHQCSRHRHHDLIGVLAASHEWSRPCAQADRCRPPEVLDGCGPLFQSPLERATDLGRIAVRPRAFNQGPAGMAMTGLGDAPLGAPLATGICRGRQAQITHQLLWVGNARKVSPCSDGRDRHGELDRPHVLLEDDWLRGRRTDDCRQPSERRRAPMGLARIAHVLSQEKGVEAIRRGVAVTETLFTGAMQISHGFVIDLGDVDGGEVARTHQPGPLAGIAAVGCDPVPSFCRHERGRDHPTGMPRLRQIAGKPIAARPGFVDKHEVFGLRVQRSNPLVEITLAGADRPQGDDLRAMVLGHVGDRDDS